MLVEQRPEGVVDLIRCELERDASEQLALEILEQLDVGDVEPQLRRVEAPLVFAFDNDRRAGLSVIVKSIYCCPNRRSSVLPV